MINYFMFIACENPRTNLINFYRYEELKEQTKQELKRNWDQIMEGELVKYFYYAMKNAYRIIVEQGWATF